MRYLIITIIIVIYLSIYRQHIATSYLVMLVKAVMVSGVKQTFYATTNA